MKITLLTISLFTAAITLAQAPKATGLIFDRKADEKVNLISKPLGFGQGLPKSMSLLEYAPSIANQGEYGTCVGWSSTYYLATMEYAILNKEKDKKEIDLFAFDPFYTYLSIIGLNSPESYTSCADGTRLADACYHLYSRGSKRKNIASLDCGDEISSYKNEQLSPLKFTDYFRVYDWEDDDDENIISACQALANKHPVLIGMVLPRSFFEIGTDGLFRPTKAEKSDPYGEALGGHAMTIVGYDDDKFGGCFTLINSWGDSWGDKGLCYVKYSDYLLFCDIAFSFETELIDNANGSSGVIYGNTINGFGAKRMLETGIVEGEFVAGKLVNGYYYNPVYSRKHKKFIKKTLKKKYNYELINESGGKVPDGFILKK